MHCTVGGGISYYINTHSDCAMLFEFQYDIYQNSSLT